MTEDLGRTVVVGVDGSECGAAAVRWAEAHARQNGGTLRLVTAWHWPASYGVPLNYDAFNPAEDARKLVEAAAAEVSLPIDRVRTDVIQGAAGDVLVRSSEHATTLVVGTRGHGTLSGALIGSTSDYCVHHAKCPVVVVR